MQGAEYFAGFIILGGFMKSLSRGRKKQDDKGFTLVELIIVIAILALLSSLATLVVFHYVEKAKKAQLIQEAKAVFDQCTYSVGSFTELDYKGRTITLEDGLNKHDPDYGMVGRITNMSCYNYLAGKKSWSKPNAYVDQVMAIGIVTALPEFSQNNYGKYSPNGKSIAQVNSLPDYSGKFVFMCVYNEDGCLYVEVYHRGYFVKFNGNQTIDDVVNTKEHPEVAFTDVYE